MKPESAMYMESVPDAAGFWWDAYNRDEEKRA